MKKLMTVALVVSGLFYAGCDKKPADAAGEGANAPAGALPAPGDAKEVVVSILEFFFGGMAEESKNDVPHPHE